VAKVNQKALSKPASSNTSKSSVKYEACSSSLRRKSPATTGGSTEWSRIAHAIPPRSPEPTYGVQPNSVATTGLRA